jgi:hypothetical protein
MLFHFFNSLFKNAMHYAEFTLYSTFDIRSDKVNERVHFLEIKILFRISTFRRSIQI